MSEEIYKTYPHNPPHLFRPCAIYMVTGGTMYKKHFLDTDGKKASFLNTLFERTQLWGWDLEAWAVMGNHYHWVAQAPANADSLVSVIRSVHSINAKATNQADGTPGRQVWYNYWDSCIDYETSYWARLHYVHTNPVKHGLVKDAIDYPFCSYRWFLEKAEANFCQQVLNQPFDQVKVVDDF
jgi:putative transposase